MTYKSLVRLHPPIRLSGRDLAAIFFLLSASNDYLQSLVSVTSVNQRQDQSALRGATHKT